MQFRHEKNHIRGNVKEQRKLGVVALFCNPSTRESEFEAGILRLVWATYGDPQTTETNKNKKQTKKGLREHYRYWRNKDSLCIHIHVSKDNEASGTEITVKVVIEENFLKKK
jgi:hypothetical protein